MCAGFQDLTATRVDKVGASNPIRDFKAMMARRDDPTVIERAIKEMAAMVMVRMFWFACHSNALVAVNHPHLMCDWTCPFVPRGPIRWNVFCKLCLLMNQSVRLFDRFIVDARSRTWRARSRAMATSTPLTCSRSSAAVRCRSV